VDQEFFRHWLHLECESAAELFDFFGTSQLFFRPRARRRKLTRKWSDQSGGANLHRRSKELGDDIMSVEKNDGTD
jgi:hypothetical protein